MKAGAKGASAFNKKITAMKKTDIQDKLFKTGMFLGILFFANKALGKAAKKSADANLDTDPAAGQARGLDAAMNRSGVSWLRDTDGTNEPAIYEIAMQIKDLDKVINYYSAQHEGKRNLTDDLIKEIGAEGHQKFLALATKGKTGNVKFQTVLAPIPANLWVVTIKQANVRKTPKITTLLKLENNIVKLVEQGKAIGATTGKFVFDEPNNVTFIEFYTLGVKQAGKHFFYVAKSQVELISDAEKKKREKTSKIPLEILAGLGGVSEDPQTQVISIRPTLIYDENFRVLLTAPKNIVLGFPLMRLNTGRGEFIKIQTVQENLRWVKAQDVKTENRL